MSRTSMCGALAVVLLLVAVDAAELARLQGHLGARKQRPVAKVVNLLKEMTATMEKEQEEDAKIYDQMVCWCETNEKAKTKAVSDGQSRDKMLTELIPELAARSAQLKVEIQGLKKETAENEAALSEATEIREKDLAAFREEEKNAVQSITGLKNAIQTIGKNHEAALSQEALLQIHQVLAKHSSESPEALRGASLLQRGSSRQPQSGAIFGILKGMKESFEGNLASSKSEEEESAAQYAQLKDAKTREITAADEQIESKSVELAAAGEKRIKSKESLADTREQVKADTAFLMDLQTRCGTMDKQFADRKKIRMEEMKAVGEALSILTDDDATDVFNRSTGFLQKLMATKSLARARASKALRVASLRLGNPRLALLATSMEDDVFEKIKVQIDDLVKNLKQEQKDEVAMKDECIEEMNTNEKELAGKNSEKKDIELAIEDSKLSIKRMKEDIDAAKTEISDTKQEMLKAEENREKENKAFQDTVMDQRATQQLVAKALKKLKAFYDAKAAALLEAEQAPPPTFAPYKKAGGAGGVVGMMEMIIDDAKKEEADAVADETEAQASYEAFVKDSSEAIHALSKAIADKTATMEKASADLSRAESDLSSTNEAIAGLESLKQTLQGKCNFLLENFDIRQSSRTQEMEALAEAKALMSSS